MIYLIVGDMTNVYWIAYHIDAETKWTPFRRRYFQMSFLEWISIKITLKFVRMGPINNIPDWLS